MATTKKAAEEAVKTTEKVVKEETPKVYEYFAPISREMQSDIFVSVNGKRWQIKRGERVTVPAEVYEVLMNMERMDSLALERMNSLKQ